MTKKLTIIDIAKMAGVGKSTVSRVINGESGVKEETRREILNLIESLEFVPSVAAQSVKRKKNRVIGVIGTRLDSHSENRTFRGIVEKAQQYEMDILYLESQFDSKKTEEQCDILKKKQVDGLIIFAIAGEEYAFLKKFKMPIIMLAQEVKGYPSIVYNDYQAIESIMNYLLQKGVRKIGYIGVGSHDYTTGYLRFSAYQDVCVKNCIESREHFGDFSYESGYKLALNLLKENIGLEAIVCATDTIALGVRKRLQELGSMILVTGVGDNPLLPFLYETHITARHQYKRSGYLAIEVMSKLLQNQESLSYYILPSELKVYNKG